MILTEILHRALSVRYNIAVPSSRPVLGDRIGRRRVAACLVALVLVAGCSEHEPAAAGSIDTDWFGSTSAHDVLAAAAAATATPVSLRLQQQARARGGVVSKDLLVAAAGDCTGELQLPAWGEPAELVVRDGNGAFRGGGSFWLSIDLDLGADPAVALDRRDQLVDTYSDRWTSTPGLDTLCEVADFLRPVAKAAADNDLVKEGLADVEGEPAGRVVSDQGDTTVTTWVALAAPHRVLRIAISHGDPADGPVVQDGDSLTTFSDFGAPVEVDFPAAAEIVAFVAPTAADQTVTDQ